MKKVAILVLNNFTNDSRVLKIANSLGKSKYDTSVVAMKEADVREYESEDHFDVHRIKLTTMNLPRWCNPLKFLEWSWRVVANYRRFDIFHCCDFETLPVGMIARWFNSGLTIVYDAHEYEAERLGLSKWRKSFIKFFEKRWIKKSNAVITVSKGINDAYVEQFDMPAHEVIFNAPAYSSIQQVDSEDRFGFRADQTIFLYSGGLSLGRGIETLLKAFAQRKDDKAVAVFMGYGKLVPLVEKYASTNKNIYFHPAVPYDQVVKMVAKADYGLLSVENVCLNYYHSMPNKLFEYMQARIPILVAELKDCQDVVEQEQIGFSGDSATPEGWNRLVDKALKTDPEKFTENLERASKKYNWEKEEVKLLALYQKALGQ